MPFGITIAAITGAALASSATGLVIAGITFNALGGALLFAGLAAASYLLAPKLSAPSLQTTRTLNTLRTEIEPARWVIGKQKIGGVMVFAQENKEQIRIGRRPDGQARHDGDVDAWRGQYFTYVMLLAEEPLDGIERLWIQGVEQPIRYGRTMTAPAGTGGGPIVREPPDDGNGNGGGRSDDEHGPSGQQGVIHTLIGEDFGEQPTPLEDQTQATSLSPIIPPEEGDWGIGDGTGIGDWPPEAEDRRRLNRGTRNVEPARYPYIIWPRLSGRGKPNYAFSRAGKGWWDPQQLTEEKGKEGHAYLVIDLYQNSRIDEDTGNQSGYNWNGVPDIQVQVRGMKLPLPLPDAGEGDAVVDSNPARAFWWYTQNRLGMPREGVDVASVIQAGADSDEDRSDNAYDDDPRGFEPGRTIPRFGFDGVIVSGDPPGEVLREMAQCVEGAIVKTNGRVGLKTGKHRDPVRDVPVEHVIGIVGAEVQPPTASRANRGTVRLRQSAIHDWQPQPIGARTEFPISVEPARANDGAAFEIDTGERAYISSPARARSLVKHELLKLRGPDGARMAVVYTIKLWPGPNDENLQIAAFDRIIITTPAGPSGAAPLLDGADVEVLTTSINPDWTVTLVVRHNGEPGDDDDEVLCPGLGDAPPALPADDSDGHVATFYAAPSTLMPEIE